MAFFKHFYFCFLLISSLFCYANEDCLYALASLKYHLELKINHDQDNPIEFSENDVASLWQRVESLEEMILAKNDYYEFLQDNNEEKIIQSHNRVEKYWDLLRENVNSESEGIFDQHLADNGAFYDKKNASRMQPHLLPEGPLKQILHTIFITFPNALDNNETYANAGFTIRFAQPHTFITVSSHPLLEGYLVKAYLNNETRRKENRPGWEWLVRRCEGVKNVQHLIKQKKLKHFVAPHKWIYITPNPGKKSVILIVTDMQLAGHAASVDAWKNKITKEHLDELFCILSHGYSSSYVVANIPYTIYGKFACIDTEHPKRKIDYSYAGRFLNPTMRSYWHKLIRKGGKK
ncbi:MAG: hypothetical protein BGO10_05810 [Chlamydia sp. 32-24]|nr:MAG: hypothetical protein BGO10_05810 [Chlamydia sp. 32-24]